ncbi:MAG: hypothetical protein HQ509_04725 [Candidatus Marinimicrobia bacterium]|nr:hypothetical protein [Candidatus Neomarinimicrobiota bacterium]
MATNKLTLKDIAREAGCPPYIVRYLYTNNRLPVIKASRGAGYPVKFHPDAIQIVKDHVNKAI